MRGITSSQPPSSLPYDEGTLLYPPTHSSNVQLQPPYLFAGSVKFIVFRRLSWQISREALHPLLQAPLSPDRHWSSLKSIFTQVQ